MKHEKDNVAKNVQQTVVGNIAFETVLRRTKVARACDSHNALFHNIIEYAVAAYSVCCTNSRRSAQEAMRSITIMLLCRRRRTHCGVCTVGGNNSSNTHRYKTAVYYYC